MTKILTNEYNFPACNHRFACSKFDNLSPVIIKMPKVSKSSSYLTLRRSSTQAKMGIISIGKPPIKWWEKGDQQNMNEIRGAEDLVESLSKAGDKLVVVDFFSPGCGGCRALQPKLCQLAEMEPDVQFLQVNYEEHKSMCYSLNVHVLPFFRFYRGAEGRLSSFSCTNATIKKFKDALAKHKPDRCSLGPTKGLEEKELLALGANQDLSFVYNLNPGHPGHQQKKIASPPLPQVPTVVVAASGSNSLSEPGLHLPLPLPIPLKSRTESKEDKDKTLVSFGR